jgi:hypothetical protein
MPPSRKVSSAETVLALLEELPRVRLGPSYTEQDRAVDFIAVFAGSSNKDQGQRVLAQINDFCSPAPNPMDADKPGLLAFKEGKRWVLGEIMRAFVPRAREPQVERKPENG